MARAAKPTQQTWGGRFATGPAEAAQRFTESVSFDWRLYRQDIAGSIAHARGLAKAGLLTARELATLERRLRRIERAIANGTFRWDRALEDVHMNI
ncbi:MAG: argininosuccinate lyase, partial [Verrucomicrobiae bacterium]|nr:argininosuccinate lyase [Verrucomicrobiae bacterium]